MAQENSLQKMEMQEDCKIISLLDLPEWALDFILDHLPALDLCRIAQVCNSLKNRSRSDYLWEKLVKQKWGSLFGDVALQEWQWHTTKIIMAESLFLQQNQNGSCGTFSGVWPFLSLHSYLENYRPFIALLKSHSKMALYIFLETGRFWFPAQAYEV